MSKEEDRKAFQELLLNSKDSLRPGSGLSWFQFSEPDFRILETFDNPGVPGSTQVEFFTEELTALCPLTSMPDFYSLSITYRPREKCVESKSAKFYFHSFRNAGMFVETLANRIADDWVKACSPWRVEVKATMRVRGGVGITAIAERAAL